MRGCFKVFLGEIFMTSVVAIETLGLPADQSKRFITARNDTGREGGAKQITRLPAAATLSPEGRETCGWADTCQGRKQHLSWEQTLPHSSRALDIPAGGHLCHQTCLLHTVFSSFVCACPCTCACPCHLYVCVERCFMCMEASG